MDKEVKIATVIVIPEYPTETPPATTGDVPPPSSN
jgi:hypothetical protein